MTSLPRISVIGLGKLGSPMAALMASKGFEVIGLDLNEDYVSAINSGCAPVEETDLQAFIDLGRSRLRATTSYEEAVLHSDVSFIIVPTPSDENALFSNRYVLAALHSIGGALRNKVTRHVVVITSTVMPGSTGGELRQALEAASGRTVGPMLGLAYNPEFIALGTVVRDMSNPDFVLIGESDEATGDQLQQIHHCFCNNQPTVRRMNFVNAELTKISVNTYVTTKISYANMLAEMCERLPDADVDVVTTAIGSDSRIGAKYLRGGVGYGGPCFPRDNQAFSALGRQLGVRCDLADATDGINAHQVERLVRAVKDLNRQHRHVTVLGLSYKPMTGVIEESQGIMLSEQLHGLGYAVSVYDPQAQAAARAVLGNKAAVPESLIDALRGADTVVLATPWPEFKSLPAAALERSNQRAVTIVDPWGIVAEEDLPENVRLVRLGRRAQGVLGPAAGQVAA